MIVRADSPLTYIGTGDFGDSEPRTPFLLWRCLSHVAELIGPVCDVRDSKLLPGGDPAITFLFHHVVAARHSTLNRKSQTPGKRVTNLSYPRSSAWIASPVCV